jgi:hypothetical protein
MSTVTIKTLLSYLSEESGFSLSEEQAYWRSTHGYTNRDLSLPVVGRGVILNSRLPLPLDKVRVGPSKVHGKGVFATKDIGTFDVITMYPGDFVNVMYEMKGGPTAKRECLVLTGSHLTEEMSGTRPQLDTAFVCRCDSTYSMVGHPGLTDDPAYLGHMINDGAMSHSPADREVYEKVSYLKANCEMVNIPEGQPFFKAIVAMKTIHAGEEILMHYGYDYWAKIRRI